MAGNFLSSSRAKAVRSKGRNRIPVLIEPLPTPCAEGPGPSKAWWEKALSEERFSARKGGESQQNQEVGAKSRTTHLGSFGEVIRATGPMAKANPMWFSTKYQDDESDLLYYGYRYYKPSTGTWLSRDPIAEFGFTLLKKGQQAYIRKAMTAKDLADKVNKFFVNVGGPNCYEFVNDNSVVAIDPDGLSWWWPWSKKQYCDTAKKIAKDAWDKVWDKLTDEVKDYLGKKIMKDAYDACDRIKFMDHNDPNYAITCQLCAIFQCAKELPVTAIAMQSCLTQKWSQCDTGEAP